MKNLLLSSALALTLAACSSTPAPVSPTPKPAEALVYRSATYTYTITATTSVVSVNAGKLGTRFCFTSTALAGVQVCNNLVSGSRTVPSGADQGVVFTEPDGSPPVLVRR